MQANWRDIVCGRVNVFACLNLRRLYLACHCSGSFAFGCARLLPGPSQAPAPTPLDAHPIRRRHTILYEGLCIEVFGLSLIKLGSLLLWMHALLIYEGIWPDIVYERGILFTQSRITLCRLFGVTLCMVRVTLHGRIYS